MTKSLKVLPNKVFRFIQHTLSKSLVKTVYERGKGSFFSVLPKARRSRPVKSNR
ncbi:unknown protein [Microcystis aeruginosa NIES-843]|uniref:Uncharacterized protein n=1 Tax=Microcystis aeruginosa (strain NIES-843 / IAM M-2473) TaxID=449447 RepID=B0JK40_MICAN|nr:unknown protein [Microcystis aeruginosa NIES-843]